MIATLGDPWLLEAASCFPLPRPWVHAAGACIEIATRIGAIQNPYFFIFLLLIVSHFHPSVPITRLHRPDFSSMDLSAQFCGLITGIFGECLRKAIGKSVAGGLEESFLT
jgi:hypothetical protein